MKSFYKFIWLPALVIFVQSCTVTKQYETPEVNQEENFRTDNLPDDSLSIADLSWKEMFTDSLLQKYINRALINNLDIRMAVQRIAIADAYMVQGKYNYYPSVGADLQYGLNIPSKNGQQGSLVNSTGKRLFNSFDIGINASWEADIWGKIHSQNEILNARYLQTLEAHKAVKTHLVAGIAKTYYLLLALDAQMEITRETIETRKSSYETTEALKNSGVGGITSTALQQTRAQYINAQALLIDLEKEARILENTISVLMGDEPHSIDRGKLDNQEIITDLKIGVPIQLLRNRPDVIIAEQEFRAAFESTNIAETAFYPSLVIGASGGLQSMDIINWLSPSSLFANLFGGLAQPIYSRRFLHTQLEVSKLDQEHARLNFANNILQASAEVSDALFTYDAAIRKVGLKQEEFSLMEQAVEDSRELLKSGYRNFSYLEVLTAQERVLGSGMDVINAKTTKLTSIVDLYRALGGGWK